MGRNTSRTNSRIGGRPSTSSWSKPFAYFIFFTPLRRIRRKARYAKHSIDALIHLGNARVRSATIDERCHPPATSRVKNSATFTRVLRVKTLSESDDWKPISPKFNNVVALIRYSENADIFLVAGNNTYGASCACL